MDDIKDKERSGSMRMIKESMLTTIDNPHSPFDEFKAWYAFDLAHGYGSIELLARITFSSEELSSADQRLANEQAIDEIVENNVTGMFTKVTRTVPDPFVQHLKDWER